MTNKIRTSLLTIILTSIPMICIAAQCKVVNKQCLDNSVNKTIDGVTFTLKEMCSKLGLTGQDCCWNQSSNYYCGEQTDTCDTYRKNTNCSIVNNTCIDKDYITGNCNKYQSNYSCASGYKDLESQVCTNVVCASYQNTESDNNLITKQCTPSPYGTDCAQYANDKTCKLTHQGTCLQPNSKTVTCNPYTYECDAINADHTCQMTTAATCSDLQRIEKTCTVQKTPTGEVFSDGCANYQDTGQWELKSQGAPYACGNVNTDTQYYSCDPTNGGCNSYAGNSTCKLTQPYVEGECTQYSYNSYYGSCIVGTYTCKAKEITHTPGCGGSRGRDYMCGTCTVGGNGSDADGCWNQLCINRKQPQLAQYACTTTTQNTCQDSIYKSKTQVQCNEGYSPAVYTCSSAGSCGKVDPSIYTCANHKCFNPLGGSNSENNSNNLGWAITYLQMGQNMAQNMNCSNQNDPSSCTLFSGKYSTCYMYMVKIDQPGSWNNNGADCMIHHDTFTQAGLPTGYAASDRSLYSQATSGTNHVMGSITNFSLSNDDSKAINNSVQLQQDGGISAVNQDQKINYTPNDSRNPNIALKNGQVVSVSINKEAAKDLSGFLSFKSYLTTDSVNLAWNRQKSEPDPKNIKNITFKDLKITRNPSGRPFGWYSGTNQPVINGLCVHLADSCQGGDDSATYSDLIKVELAGMGSYTNPNFCAKCTTDLIGNCITPEPKDVVQQWCCFSSKAAMDINLAAYDQGLIDFYTGNGSRYADQINHPNGNCGGVTVETISKIDFSKGDYFKDLMSSIDINKIIDNSSFTNVNIQGNTQTRSSKDATNMVDEWSLKNGK